MAKRHQSLIPLAQDHHRGLILALRLQQGKESWTKPRMQEYRINAQEVVAFYEHDLKPHFAAEEQGLFPLARNLVKEAQGLVEELIADHRRLEQFVHHFRKPRGESLAHELFEFGKLLEAHIRKEDRILFPMFEEHASADVLAEAEKSIAQHSTQRPTITK